MINKLLRKRILGLTGDAATLPPERMEAENQQAIDSLSELMTPGKGTISREMEIFRSTAPQGPRLIDGSPLPEGMVPGPTMTMEYRDYNQNGIEDRKEGIYLPRDLVPESSLSPKMNYPDAFFARPPEGGFRNMDPGFGQSFPKTMPSDTDPLDDMDEETKQQIQDLLGKSQQKIQAPLAPLAEQLAMAGEGEDTALAHVRPGEIVIPPEFMDDAKFESALEKKFKEFNIDPEQAVVGAGIASLNPQTGLEQFGFFKKLGKKLKKVVKKVASIAAFIPGVGTALGGVLGGIGGLATKIPVIGGTLGKIGSTVAGGIAKLGIPGISPIAGGTAGGFSGIVPGLQNPLAGGIFGQTGSTFAGGPAAGQGLANQFGLGSGTPNQVAAYNQAQQAQAALNSMTPAQIAANPQQYQQLQQLAAGSGGGMFSRMTGGGGGIGGSGGGGGGGFLGGLGQALKIGGIGALAAGLGKLAYEDAQKQTGVPLTPLTTMSPTGRYNIEAEIARRMGQPTPNPVEFGLLPAGTIPELSGGKPKGMSLGGAIEELQGGMAMGMQEGGPVALDSLAPAPISRTPDMMMFSIDAEIKNLMTEYDMVVRNKEFERAQMIADEIDQLQQQKIAIQSQNMPQQKPQRKGIGSMPMMMYGGPVMAYAQGGAVALQEGGELDPSQFPKMDGDINGPGTETSDDIPAMLSDGEFVMTGRAVRGAGSYDMQKDSKGIISLTPSFNEDRERGMDLMYKMMDTFAGEAKPS
tara:strand:+ start:91 stop:2331 length:2241 start_codon:yes stop_codon:yes gene_type:complete